MPNGLIYHSYSMVILFLYILKGSQCKLTNAIVETGKPFQNYLYAEYHTLFNLLLLGLENMPGNNFRGKGQPALHKGRRGTQFSSNSINCFELDPKHYRQACALFQAYSKILIILLFQHKEPRCRIIHSHFLLFRIQKFSRELSSWYMTALHLDNHPKVSSIVKFYVEY